MKQKKPRNWTAVNAWFRKSGAFKNKKRDSKKRRQLEQKLRKNDEGLS